MNPSVVRPFEPFFEPSTFAIQPLRQAITAAWRLPEPEAVQALLAGARTSPVQARNIRLLAARITQALRTRKGASGRAGLVQKLLQEYALSSQEGIALMCLAEALLRIPDAATRDALIRDKIAQGQWQPHLGKSPSLFVNAATWGLLITGKLVSTHSESGLSAAIGRLVATGGEPLIRKGVDMAMRMMGEQFVAGETIAEALWNAREKESEGFRYSFDMLGEAALTAHDAQRYLHDYEAAIDAIGQASAGRGVLEGAGISIKLSALHPRYSRAQYGRVMNELYPVLLSLCVQARRHDIGLNIDAEEADRLELSLDLLERLAFEPALQGWEGLGFVVQAYQKRCPFVIDYLVDLARRSHRRLMVRLVKGAYWDSEIKRAQADGQDGYPVYTRKTHTDAAYIACARKLLEAPAEVFPQFATHNAQTLATIHEIADPSRYTPSQYEFQCLHGMGEPLYEQVVGSTAQGRLGRPCRIYAPVGTHDTLLAYLVRRLLENGANTSFVHRVADPSIAIDTLVRDPVEGIEEITPIGLPHPAIPLPRELYGAGRLNSRGLDLNNETQLQALEAAMQAASREVWIAEPMLGASPATALATKDVLNPADANDKVGTVREASREDVELALECAQAGAAPWAATPPAERARLLETAAMGLESRLPRLMSVLIREAGKTASNAISEVREAADFLRYYAQQVRERFDNAGHVPLGPVACISPWNFPLAIFMGQVAAALAAGNTVLAKPAEQTPLVAAEAVRALWEAGIPRSAVQLLPGTGPEVGAPLVGDARVQGVLFTGSTEVARMLQASVAGRVNASGRAIPLIAETGGQNAMIVDSSALPEQVVGDAIISAFDSAGQRCSALRVLCVQEDVADRILQMLLGAMAEWQAGDPAHLACDAGPVIDREAQERIERHVEDMRAKSRRVHRPARTDDGALPSGRGTFVLPTLIEIERISELEHEVFGPVLHFMRYGREDLGSLIEQINATDYGLTMGLHTRIDETIERVAGAAHAGNLYVNRNMIGAVVGVQPFGGEGLSGTGPKAGGPLYLYRLLARRPQGVLAGIFNHATVPFSSALEALLSWIDDQHGALASSCRRIARAPRPAGSLVLPGPTGERNAYTIAARTGVLCLAHGDHDRLLQLAAVLATGSRAVWFAEADDLLDRLPHIVQQYVTLANGWSDPRARFDSVLLHGSLQELAEAQQQLARRAGPVVSVERMEPGEDDVPLERLVIERASSINTAAAGGNASLMAIG